MSFQVTLLPPDRVRLDWPNFSALVRKSLAKTDLYLESDILDRVEADLMQLWPVFEVTETSCAPVAIVLTQLCVYPRAKILEVIACVGSGMNEWLPLLASIEQWAKAQGCNRIVPLARPGWERILAPLGYEKTHVRLEKVL